MLNIKDFTVILNVAVLIIANNWTQPKCPLAEGWINKPQCVLQWNTYSEQ